MYEFYAVLTLSALITVFIETVVLLCFKVKDWRLVVAVPLNISTNVLLNTILSLQQNTGWLLYARIVVFELLIIQGEAIIYSFFKKEKKNYLISAIANIASCVIGSIILYIVFKTVLK